MHIPDGILPASVCVTAAIGASGITFVGFRGLADRDVPRIAVMAALVFVVGAVHVRVGPGSVHFLCTGLLATVLGWRAVVPVVVGVLMHAVLLQHGGLTVVGVNALILGVPAMVVGWLCRRWELKGSSRRTWCVGGAATLATYLLSFAMFFATMALADQRLYAPLGVWVAMHLPIVFLEAVVTGSAAAYLTKVRRGVLQPCCDTDVF